ncbi:hypothetical protein AOLI_G00022200 [Acnodon oligacanthus]
MPALSISFKAGGGKQWAAVECGLKEVDQRARTQARVDLMYPVQTWSAESIGIMNRCVAHLVGVLQLFSFKWQPWKAIQGTSTFTQNNAVERASGFTCC